MQLVKNFRTFLQESEGVSAEVVEINKSLLKIVTGHIANVRRQGTREISRNESVDGGKIIIVKNKFKGKSADEIWSTLILSLPIDEINRMTPRETNIVNKEESTVAKKEEKTLDDTNPPISITHPAVVVSKPPSGKTLKKPVSKSVTIVDGPEDDEVFKNTTNASIKQEYGSSEDLLSNNEECQKLFAEKTNNLQEPEVADTDKRKSVRDLKKAYDQYANESTVSLADHVAKEVTPKTQARRPKSNNFDKWKPLTREGHAWILSATRGDYQTLARLAKSDPELISCRDPATGYTALHWAAKHGHADIVKLLAGSYGQDPDMKTRGGYTPLILAGMCKREEVFDLLTKAYNANEDIRDFSGVKARQYLDQQHMNIPGFPPPVDLSHDPLLRSRSLRRSDTSRKSRTKVARSATHHFMKELRDSVRDVRGSIRANIKIRPKSIGE